jgi:hypothetical protein
MIAAAKSRVEFIFHILLFQNNTASLQNRKEYPEPNLKSFQTDSRRLSVITFSGPFYPPGNPVPKQACPTKISILTTKSIFGSFLGHFSPISPIPIDF